MKQKLNKYQKHIEKKRDFYWGKDERIYLFYHAQSVLLNDLKIKGLLKDEDSNCNCDII